WKAIEKLTETSGAGTQAFVAMWFDPSTQDAYDNGLFKAIYDSGYDPLRIDKKEHNNKIDDEIIAEIKRSRFLYQIPEILTRRRFPNQLGSDSTWRTK